MSELIVICAVLGLLAVILVLMPFAFGVGGRLQSASADDDDAILMARRDAILNRWLRDEAASLSGEITAREWRQRQRYLTSRYVDTVRRLAWLRSSLGMLFASILLSQALSGPFSHVGVASAQVSLAPKQLWVLKPGSDQIVGTWVAAVLNNGSKPEIYRLPLLLPREALDFRPLEGAVEADIKLGDDGVWVERQFAPGVNMVSFAFTVPAAHGARALSALPRTDVGELSVMTPKGMLEIRGANFAFGGDNTEGPQRYSMTVSTRMIMAGDLIKVEVSGVPEGRRGLWLTGGVIGLMLAGFAVWLSIRTRESVDSVSGAAV